MNSTAEHKIVEDMIVMIIYGMNVIERLLAH